MSNSLDAVGTEMLKRNVKSCKGELSFIRIATKINSWNWSSAFCDVFLHEVQLDQRHGLASER